MAKRAAVGFLTLAPAVLLAVFFLPVEHGARSYVFVSVVMGFPVALAALGASRAGSLGRLRAPLLVLLLALQAGALGTLAFTGTGIRGPHGFPLSLHFLLALVWIVPLFVSTVAYALTFDALGIDEALLRRIESRRSAELQRGEPDP